jgi:hypothetical protein
MTFRLPLWVYWTLAGLAVAAAAAFTIYWGTASESHDGAAQVLFTAWGGPITLVVTALLITLLHRKTRRT